MCAPSGSLGIVDSTIARIASLVLSAVLVVGVLASSAVAETKRYKIGRSVDGRPIQVVERGDLSSSAKLLLVGNIHGNERAGVAVIQRLRRSRALRGVHLYLIRTANPDGMRADTRQNGRGVDLNRNFNHRWKAIGERWDTYYSGPRPWSEPETRAIRNFVLDVRPRITIYYHQAMSLVTKLGGSKDRRIQRRYARIVDLPLRRLWRPGTATRWQNKRLGRTTPFVVELPGGAMSGQEVRRHARAVRTIARMVRLKNSVGRRSRQ